MRSYQHKDLMDLLSKSIGVSKFQNEIQKILFVPKYERKIVRIYALNTTDFKSEDYKES
jgi:hypothetical protein